VVRRCRSVAFVDWRDAVRRGPRAFIKAVAKYVLGLLGEGVVCPRLFFEAEKPRGKL
jgi:hypothetical protein